MIATAFVAGAVLLTLAGPARASDALLAPQRPFFERVLAEHPRAALAQRGIDQARADADTLDQPLYNPEIGYSGEHLRTPAGTEGAGGTTRTHLLELSLTTDFGVKQDSRRLIGERGVDAAQAAAAEERLALTGDSLAALARFQGAQSQERLAAQQERLMQSFLHLAERLRKAGDSSAADLTLARLALAETTRLRSETRVELADAREEVRGLCGCRPEEVSPLPEPMAPDALAGEDAETMLDSLPAVRMARARVEVARADLRLARDERIPDPTFRLGGGQEGDGTKITFGLSVPLPVLNSGSAKVTSAGRALASAEAAETVARRAARTNLAAKRAAAAEAWQGWRDWQAHGVLPAEQQAAILERLWLGGEISATDYFVQLRETVRVAQQGAELWSRAWSSLADALRAANRIETVVGMSS